MAKLYELIDLFAEVANEFIDDNKSLGIDIQNKIIEEKIIYENILINGYWMRNSYEYKRNNI